MRVTHQDGREGTTEYINYNPMAGLIGAWVKLADGSEEFWTIGEIKESS